MTGIIDDIQRLIDELAGSDYKHRPMPEFLELLEEGEDWVKRMREFLEG